jgi:transcriptional regulator NrdR family protein
VGIGLAPTANLILADLLQVDETAFIKLASIWQLAANLDLW